MKECQVVGIVGDCCRQNHECILKIQASLESEKNSLHLLRQSIEKFDGCRCKTEALEIIKIRIENQAA